MAESSKIQLIYTQPSKRDFSLLLRDGTISILTWLLWGYLLAHPLYYFTYAQGEPISPLLQLSLQDLLKWTGVSLATILILYYFWSRTRLLKWWWKRRSLWKQVAVELLRGA
ncbi:hypothetical protein BTA51_13800 [Hahella sp. CCB-MM4]|uniref:hypothetical protein n=1 Tax=Hahella sp. (strain CCB-MM4) TaxID=1926491 RepID=UPI000B9BFA67|nr:hypothetical protein [Hahella sp. CCB-MM4]OZG73022.1 hypothetical protein BTA51_13800 [Hahella sp. CCB-MM4]